MDPPYGMQTWPGPQACVWQALHACMHAHLDCHQRACIKRGGREPLVQANHAKGALAKMPASRPRGTGMHSAASVKGQAESAASTMSLWSMN